MSHPEFEVSRSNLYINSNNRSRAPYTIQDDGKIKLNLDAMNVEASDSQFLRISLLQFSCSNTFDRHISPNTNFYIYVGDQINNTLTVKWRVASRCSGHDPEEGAIARSEEYEI